MNVDLDLDVGMYMVLDNVTCMDMDADDCEVVVYQM
jgi:hypothetical protein